MTAAWGSECNKSSALNFMIGMTDKLTCRYTVLYIKYMDFFEAFTENVCFAWLKIGVQWWFCILEIIMIMKSGFLFHVFRDLKQIATKNFLEVVF
jgi:hypothetical protein